MYQLELTLKPLLQIFELPKNLHASSFSLHATRGTMKFFELQTVLQSMENLHLPSKRVAQVKNSSGPWRLSCLSCVDRAKSILKRSEQENNEGKGYGVRAVGTPMMVIFNKRSFQILPVNLILVNSLNGLFWQLLSTVYYLKEMRRHHQLEGLLSKITSSTVLAALRPKMPTSHADSTVYFNNQLVIARPM